jgi:hypothetical protein
VAAFALAAVVLTVSALASGVVERAPLSFPIIFLGLGFLIGVRRSLAYLFCTVYHSPFCLSMYTSRRLLHLNLIAYPDGAAVNHPRAEATTAS